MENNGYAASINEPVATVNIVNTTGSDYEKSLPVGSRLVAVNKVGGKSVKWNQLVDAARYDSAPRTSNGVTWTKNADGSLTYSGTLTNTYTSFYISRGDMNLVVSHLCLFIDTHGPQNASISRLSGTDGVLQILRIKSVNASGANIYTAITGDVGDVVSGTKRPYIIDLTAIFGAGNEPTSTTDARIAELKAIAAAIPQYDAGSIKHAAVDIVRGDAPLIIPQAVRDLPDYGAGVGEVYNEIDMEPVVYHNMKAVDLGTLNWAYDAAYKRFSHSAFTEAKTPTSNSVAFNAVCSKYAARPATFDAGVYDGISLATNGILLIYDSKYTDAAAFKSALSGVILHYEATTGGEDYAARLYRHRVGKRILDGSETWTIESGVRAYTAEYRAKRYDFSPYYKGRIISTMQTADTKNILSNEELSLYSVNTGAYPNQNWIYARLDNAQSGLDYKNYFQEHPATLYFELAAEQVFDITPYFPAAPVVNISPGGSVVFENAPRLEVPNSLSILTKT